MTLNTVACNTPCDNDKKWVPEMYGLLSKRKMSPNSPTDIYWMSVIPDTISTDNCCDLNYEQDDGLREVVVKYGQRDWVAVVIHMGQGISRKRCLHTVDGSTTYAQNWSRVKLDHGVVKTRYCLSFKLRINQSINDSYS